MTSSFPSHGQVQGCSNTYEQQQQQQREPIFQPNVITGSLQTPNSNYVSPPPLPILPVVGVEDDNYLDSFPPGFRFCPLDHELILHYLRSKINNQRLPPNRIRDTELYNYTPEYLTQTYKAYGENVWYFFTPRDKKYKNGTRPKRSAGDGYWKATGADRNIMYRDALIGYRKALVFYRGKPPKGTKTAWIMHEYRVDTSSPRRDRCDMRLDDWVLCKIYNKSDYKDRRRWRGSIQEEAANSHTSPEENSADENELEITDTTERDIPESEANVDTHDQELLQPFENGLIEPHQLESVAAMYSSNMGYQQFQGITSNQYHPNQPKLEQHGAYDGINDDNALWSEDHTSYLYCNDDYWRNHGDLIPSVEDYLQNTWNHHPSPLSHLNHPPDGASNSSNPQSHPPDGASNSQSHPPKYSSLT